MLLIEFAHLLTREAAAVAAAVLLAEELDAGGLL